MNVYALKNRNAPLSSSGGAFPAIVEYFCKGLDADNVIVYGAAFTDEFDIKHIRVRYTDGLDKLFESKYAQSNMTGLFSAVKDDLNAGLYVVFVGCPCQVDAVNKYLSRQNISTDTLLTIDLICHGTPGNKFWNEYVNYIRRHLHAQLKEIHFRYKGSKKSSLAYILSDGRIEYNPDSLYIYMRLFSRNLTLSRKCFSCPHRNESLSRPGDFTIGDFWGVSEILPRFKNLDGVSLVLCNTERAEQLVGKMLQGLDNSLMIAQCSDNSYLEYNPHLHIQTPKPESYDAFWKDYHTMDFDAFIAKWGKEPFKNRAKVFLSKLSDKLGIKYKLKHFLNKNK